MHNSEAWHDIEDKDILPLEKVDEALKRFIECSCQNACRGPLPRNKFPANKIYSEN